MVTSLMLSKDLNNISLAELISSLKSHEIELEEDEPQKKSKSVALKSRSERRKPERNKAFQSEEDDYDSKKEDSDDEEELSLLSRRIKSSGEKEITTSKDPHRRDIIQSQPLETDLTKRNECQKLKKDNSKKEGLKKNSLKAKKKGLVAIWDESDSEASESVSEASEFVSEEEQANVAFMDTTSGSSSERESDSKEKLRPKFKNLEKVHEETVEEYLEITLASSDEKTKESEEAEKETSEAPEVTINKKRSRNRQNVSEELILGNKNEPVRIRSTFKVSEETLLGLVSLIEPTSCEEALQNKKWILEMKKELYQFAKNDVWIKGISEQFRNDYIIDAEERIEARLVQEAKEWARKAAEEMARIEAEERAKLEAEKFVVEAVAVEAKAKAKTDAKEVVHIAAEEAAKTYEVALTRGESSTYDLALLVLKTLEELHKEQQLVRARLDKQDQVNSSIQSILAQLL
ncbi:uncharacterized protein LOC127122904 [Lathyrus oleraceus]|uniref:uncharacterized protein LOC127122904 n=1 Tax=Pisum sativum TaxID=3888 RepID=UPI0021D0A979|nr:uncharacterized protein LOC127122904 [Pisum sativum]